MSDESAKEIVGQLLAKAKEACEVAKTAARNSKSLGGDNFYGNSFHKHVVALEVLESKVYRFAQGAELAEDKVVDFQETLSVIKDTSGPPAKRNEALKKLSLFCESVLLPTLESMTASPVPATEQVLPMSVVKGTRRYIEKVILQANGCYERQWYDACSVMIRRFVETLIIEVYEAQKRPEYIKDNNGHNHMLAKLIDLIMTDPSMSLGRETQRGLPLLKSLGDRSAHNRYFIAKKEDVDKVIHDLRVIADELLHKAGLK